MREGCVSTSRNYVCDEWVCRHSGCSLFLHFSMFPFVGLPFRSSATIRLSHLILQVIFNTETSIASWCFPRPSHKFCWFFVAIGISLKYSIDSESIGRVVISSHDVDLTLYLIFNLNTAAMVFLYTTCTSFWITELFNLTYTVGSDTTMSAIHTFFLAMARVCFVDYDED